MIDARLLAFLGVAVVLIVTPGPDTALTVRNALAGGRRTALETAAGVASGQLLWGSAAAGGIAALLAASAVAFSVLKLAGGLFLLLLGLRTLLGALRGRAAAPPSAVKRTRFAYLQGFLNNLLNPKAAVIFISVFPAFARPGDSPYRLAFMVIAFAGMTLVWLSLYAIVLGTLRRQFGVRVKRWLDAAAGSVMVGLGARLALERS